MIEDCYIIKIPKIVDSRGSLVVIEEKNHIPFNIKRIFYLCDIPEGAERGGHAHKQLQEFIIALSGNFNVHTDNGYQKKVFFLDKPDYGLYVPKKTWLTLNCFTSDSVCLVLASDFYDESNYYRDYADFIRVIKK